MKLRANRKGLSNLSSRTIEHTSLVRPIAVLAAIVSSVALVVPSAGSADTFTVNSRDDVDDGACGVHCSLREAINASNVVAGTDTIRFDIALPPFTIRPTLPLPTATDPALIDGTTQPGFSGTPIVELDGSAAGVGDGLRITAGNSTVRGLVINRFSSQLSGFAGISLELGGGNVIAGNYIGTDPAGTAASSNNHGVQILGSSGNTIGGTAPGARNVISGNSVQGVLVADAARGNIIEGNFIGTDAGGAVDLGNGASGVFVSEGASDNTIGGTSAAARNVISGNENHGVILVGPSTTDNDVQGNFVGTDAAGTAGLGNAVDGVRVRDGSNNNTIGGPASGAGNVISDAGEFGVLLSGGASDNVVQGNLVGTDATGTAALGNGADFVGNGAGVRLSDATTNNTVGGTAPGAGNVISANLIGVHLITAATANLVQGNLIGTDASGTAPLGNIMEGVRISSGPSANTIGGTTPGAGNTIAFNGLDGVRVVEGAFANALLSNSIFSNGSAGFRGLGIDLIRSDDVVESGGVSPNDGSDLDTGGNNVQNFPVLASVLSDGESIVIQGTLNSQPATAYRLEFFSNEACGRFGFGDGKTLLGSTNVTTDTDGNASFTETFATAVPAGQVVTSTATDPAGNTSEFSRCQVVDPAADLALTKSASPASVRVGEPLTYTLDVTNKSPSSASGVTLTDLLPKSVRLRSARSDHGRCAQRRPRRVECNLAELSSGEIATVTIVVRPTRKGTIVNTATVRASQPIDLKPANNTAIATTEVSP